MENIERARHIGRDIEMTRAFDYRRPCLIPA
jgi:hypothetical protein